MSGALGSIGSIAQGEGLAALGSAGGVGGLLAGPFGSILATASWRGVSFFMPSSQDQAGRRLIQLWFPGSDRWRAQDFGKLDGPIHVRGLIIGDDYVIRATRMRTALMQAGAAMLVHPWWGSLRCRLLQPGTIEFSDSEIGVARFEATFVREPVPTTSGGLFSTIANTVENVLTSADSLMDQATLVMRSILSPVSVGLALASAVNGVVSNVSGVWDGVCGGSSARVQAATAAALAALAGGVSEPTQNTDTTWADTITTVFSGVPVALADAATVSDTSAVAPATEVAGDTDAGIAPADAVALLLSAATQIGTSSSASALTSVQPGAVAGTALVARIVTVAQALAAQTGQTYASQTDAVASRDTMLAALDALETSIEATAALVTFPVLDLSLAVMDARMAVTADINARIGRLPALVSVSVGGTVNAWALAYAVAGDTGSAVASTWDDLIARNGILHPDLVGPGTIAVLEPSS
ncbi:DNA circulation family protein [Acetobacter estunensis NRIC 0472]|uniref:DNA circulation N-terminal domain-containing protein n=1 Tax=Acetobacter estunensis TaxID=104097 RepID=A0A967BBH6_9PROT|nr:DNA circularization N-terminal domain-containing protein [Acetobacter estunensis]NHO53312.1 hypothetical protein [Acetobacter estunensis]GBQ23512.1 DNA circulation family protein [Acetobacter estunensis NRIC 0472]